MARILVIEDDAAVADYLASALRDMHHEVELARDGGAGYRAILRPGPAFDVILCDLYLPGMPGKLLLDRVGAVIRGRTPVIVISGAADMLAALGETRQWAFSVMAKPFELAHLTQTIEHALEQRDLLAQVAERDRQIAELEQRVEFLTQQNLELHAEARRDALTGLPTRLQLQDDLRAMQSACERYGTGAVLALVDMDDFRRFNAEGGYRRGDEAIRAVAERLERSSRDCDRVYRFGGDEFVLLMPCESVAQGAEVLDRLRQNVREAGVVAGASSVTLSAGVVGIEPWRRASLQERIDEANALLKRAKQAGGDRVVPAAAGHTAARA